MQTLTDILRRTVQVNGSKPATVFNGRRHTWKEMEDRVARLASALVQRGHSKGSRIAGLGLNSDRYYEFLFFPGWMGASFVPINIRLALPEIIYWLTNSDSEVLLIDDPFLPMLPEIKKQVPQIETVVYIGENETPTGLLSYEEMIAGAEPMAPVEINGQDVAGLFYTGGTTGRSKGVMLSHFSLSYNALQMLPMYKWDCDDSYLHVAPMFHLADGIHSVITATMGIANHFIPTFDPVGTMKTIQENKITSCAMVPLMVGAVVHHPDVKTYDLSSLKTVVYGASPMPESVVRQAIQVIPQAGFLQIYGQTEASPAITCLEPKCHALEGPYAGKLRSAGQAVPGVTLSIRDDQGNPVPPGTPGEIWIRGGNVMLGYNGMPEVTAETITDGWLHTGDGGYLDEDGFLFIVDRMKDMIISGGENVYSQEVENAIYQHPAIAEAAVIGIPSDKWGEQVHAIVRLKPDHTLSEEALIAYCKAQIAGYKCPRSVFISKDPLPVSGAGKLLKKEMRKPYWEGRESQI